MRKMVKVLKMTPSAVQSAVRKVPSVIKKARDSTNATAVSLASKHPAVYEMLQDPDTMAQVARRIGTMFGA